MRRGVATTLRWICLASVCACVPATGACAATTHRSVVLAFIPVAEPELARAAGMSVGIASATQGPYSAAQMLLDITQGARIASSDYPGRPPELELHTPANDGKPGTPGWIAGWSVTRQRAEDAPQLLRPGLLAAQIPGGGAYAGITGTDELDAVAVADRGGRVAAVSLGSPSTLLERIAALDRTHRLVVADLPSGAEGHTDLGLLASRRTPGELLLVLQRARRDGHELLWAAAAGLSHDVAGRHELTSRSTEQRGLISAVDIAPTILEYLDRSVPADMRGYPITSAGALHSSALIALMARLRVIAPRRLHALGFLLLAWAILLIACARRPRLRAWAVRSGALGVLWAPLAVLFTAALEPDAAVEYTLIVLVCLMLGALTDALLPWPRAPLAIAMVVLAALILDALVGTQLLMRSLLGPDPSLGARFYGIGNELKSGLAVLVFSAVAAAMYPAVRGRRAASAIAIAGILLALVEGSARIGAGVGGVILVCAATAVAGVMLAPGALTRRRALMVLIAPVAGLVVLAALDLATAHGSGQFTASILHARSPGDVRDIILRRYGAAWKELANHAMPAASAVALAAVIAALRRADRLLEPVGGDPLWRAALTGGVAAGAIGAFVEDSGPVLLVVAVFALGCVLSYLWAPPAVSGGVPSRQDALRGAVPAGSAEHDLVL